MLKVLNLDRYDLPTENQINLCVSKLVADEKKRKIEASKEISVGDIATKKRPTV